MNRAKRRAMRDVWAFLPIGLLMLLGILLRGFVYDMSAGYAWWFFGAALVLGIGGGVLLRLTDLGPMFSRAGWIYGGCLLGMLALPAIAEYAGLSWAKRWIGYQNAQYLWLLFPLAYGLLLYRLRGLGWLGLIIGYLCFLLPALGAYMHLSYGTLCECLGAIGCFATLLSAVGNGYFGRKKRIALALILFGTLCAACLYCIAEPYRMHRLLSLFRPESDARGNGWLTLRLREILGASVWLGRGGALPPETEQWMLYAGDVSVQRDFFLTFLIYRFGRLAAVPPVACMLAFFIAALRRVRMLSGRFGKPLAWGVLAVLCAQTVFSLMTNLGFPLWMSAFFPFLSYGSLAFLTDLLLVGALLSLLRHDAPRNGLPLRRRSARIGVAPVVPHEK